MSEEEYDSDENYGEEGEEEVGEEGKEGEEEQEKGEEGEEEEEEEEKEPEDPPNPLSEEVMHESLSQLARIGPGLAHAYIRADVSNRELTDIEFIRTYIHLRNINISNNLLKDISALNSMVNMLLLNASSNKLPAIELEVMPYLQVANFDHNRCKTLDGMSHPLLERLSVEFNEIERFYLPDPSKMDYLRVLDLRGNKLTSATGVYPPNIEELYMPSNLIEDLSGMEGLNKLKVLHLRDNQMVKLESIELSKLPSLSYLNLRGNLIEDIQEVKHLTVLQKLNALVLQDNPVCDLDDYRIEIWAALEVKPTLQRLDKDILDEDEMNDAEELLERQKIEEADALAAALEEEMERKREESQEEGLETQASDMTTST